MSHSQSTEPKGLEPRSYNAIGRVLLTPGDPAESSLLRWTRKRLSGAFGVSVCAHVVGVALALMILKSIPPTTYTHDFEPRNYDIVWIPVEGPGGGGGGGGNESPEPPQVAELPGPDPVSVPVAKPEPVAPDPEPEPQDEPEPPQQELNIPARTLAASNQTLPGVLEGMTASSTLSQGSGVGGGAGTGTGTGSGPGDGPGLGPGWGGGTGGGAYRPGSGVELPRLIREVKPQYTADAMRAKVQGTVLLECIVLPDGTVGDVRVVRSLDPVFGLDEEAIRAARQWRFQPGTRFGEPVAVVVTIELTFTLR